MSEPVTYIHHRFAGANRCIVEAVRSCWRLVEFASNQLAGRLTKPEAMDAIQQIIRLEDLRIHATREMKHIRDHLSEASTILDVPLSTLVEAVGHGADNAHDAALAWVNRVYQLAWDPQSRKIIPFVIENARDFYKNPDEASDYWVERADVIVKRTYRPNVNMLFALMSDEVSFASKRLEDSCPPDEFFPWEPPNGIDPKRPSALIASPTPATGEITLETALKICDDLLDALIKYADANGDEFLNAREKIDCYRRLQDCIIDALHLKAVWHIPMTDADPALHVLKVNMQPARWWEDYESARLAATHLRAAVLVKRRAHTPRSTAFESADPDDPEPNYQLIAEAADDVLRFIEQLDDPAHPEKWSTDVRDAIRPMFDSVYPFVERLSDLHDEIAVLRFMETWSHSDLEEAKLALSRLRAKCRRLWREATLKKEARPDTSPPDVQWCLALLEDLRSAVVDEAKLRKSRAPRNQIGSAQRLCIEHLEAVREPLKQAWAYYWSNDEQLGFNDLNYVERLIEWELQEVPLEEVVVHAAELELNHLARKMVPGEHLVMSRAAPETNGAAAIPCSPSPAPPEPNPPVPSNGEALADGIFPRENAIAYRGIRCDRLSDNELSIWSFFRHRSEATFEQIIGKHDDAVWRERYTGRNDQLRKVAKALSVLGSKFAANKPPIPVSFSCSRKKGLIKKLE